MFQGILPIVSNALSYHFILVFLLILDRIESHRKIGPHSFSLLGLRLCYYYHCCFFSVLLENYDLLGFGY